MQIARDFLIFFDVMNLIPHFDSFASAASPTP
jgi:hypothetical protein